MADGGWKWYTPLKGHGQIAFNVYECRKLVLSTYEEFDRQGLIYYHQKTDDQDLWIQYLKDDVQDDYGWEKVEYYSECHPQQVARDILIRTTYGGELPSSLEEYGKYEDPAVYHAWTAENNVSIAGRDEFPRPSWDGGVLMFRGKLCKSYEKRVASEQFKILDAFEKQGWPQTLPAKSLAHVNNLKGTMKNMNNSIKFIKFMIGKREVRWERSSMA